MQNKTVIIAGAGFSAPARIPIQNQIMNDMIAQAPSILESTADELDLDTKAFLDAFVRVGLYLLDNYCSISDEDIKCKFNGITNQALHTQYEYAQQVTYLEKIFNGLLEDATKLLMENPIGNYNELNQFLAAHMPSCDDYFQNMGNLKGQIKQRLNYLKSISHSNICLENLFTALDKATGQKTHSRFYTYDEEDRVKHSILRLFVYYFAKRLRQHQYDQSDYLSFLRYTKLAPQKIAFLTTNWDTLPEEYFRRYDIMYDLGLNSTYFRFDPHKKQATSKGIKLVKLHGSINWFRCLKCGTITIIDHPSFGNFLFDENSIEKCKECNSVAINNVPLLQPEIMTPTMIKMFDNQLYKNLWRAGALELREANKVIFVGYSMPIADFELRYMLQENIPADAQIDVVLHKSDNPAMVPDSCASLKELLPQQRYQDAFGKNKIRFFYNGFGEYFQAIS